MNEFTHVNEQGELKMVDVSDKPLQRRIACAQGEINLSSKTIELIKDNQIKKGNVLTVAQLAGIQAAKQTANLIPLCHLISLDEIAVSFEFKQDGIIVRSRIKNIGSTGVEMEALTAVSIALLTIYDMCKAVDSSMRIAEIFLVKKVKEDGERR